MTILRITLDAFYPHFYPQNHFRRREDRFRSEWQLYISAVSALAWIGTSIVILRSAAFRAHSANQPRPVKADLS